MLALKKAGATAVAVLLATTFAVSAAERSAQMPRPEGWLVKSFDELKSPAPPSNAADEINAVKSIVAKRTPAEVQRAQWWAVGGPAYRWNEIANEAVMDEFATLPIAARHLALVHAAIDDAVTAAWRNKKAFARQRPSAADASIQAVVPVPAGSSYPSDYAAAAVAAAEVLGAIFPAQAAAFKARAEEAMGARVLAGVEFPSDVAAGREIGRKAAALAIAHGKADGSDAKWAGTIPQGPGRWNGTNPIAPAAANWKPWVLSRPDEMRPPAPPAHDSDQTKRALAELKEFKRTPKTNHRATYWEVFGGARAHALWNEVARTKILEQGDAIDPPTATRMLAALNIAFTDAGIACWDAKYAYWYIRPPQLDPELKTVFPAPNHPSYPAAHGCFSTSAATVLASLFPRDRERLLAMGKEAAEARVWAGIHYRFDIDAGQALGRAVAEKVLARSFTGSYRAASAP